jgi:hypothetical protein
MKLSVALRDNMENMGPENWYAFFSPGFEKIGTIREVCKLILDCGFFKACAWLRDGGGTRVSSQHWEGEVGRSL